jgi:hypothetical protein
MFFETIKCPANELIELLHLQTTNSFSSLLEPVARVPEFLRFHTRLPHQLVLVPRDPFDIPYPLTIAAYIPSSVAIHSSLRTGLI